MVLGTANVSTPCLSYTRQAHKWLLIDDLCGGTRAMQEAGERWLYKEDKEDHSEYRSRLKRSILFAALSETIETAVARPLAKPPTIQEAETLDERLALLEDDADRSGTSLADLTRELMTDACKYGRWHLLVDYPSVAPGATIKDERDVGARPYFVRVSPRDLIGWRAERGEDGQERVTQIRVRETTTEPDGEFGEKEVEQIRVLTETDWRIYRQTDKRGEWAEVSSGPLTLGKIPLVTVYFKRRGIMESDPPFEALADLNLAHWQSSSDQRNLLRVARVPILTARGLSQTEMDQPIVVGRSNVLKSTNPDAVFGYVEHSGAALGAGRQDLMDLKAEMEAVGLAPLTERSGAVTATAKAIDESKSSSDLEAWTRVTEYGLYHAYELAAEWIGAKLAEGFSVDLYTDFGLSLRTTEDAQTLIGLYQAHAITAKTLLTEFKRRGVLGQMVDPEEEAQAAKDENPFAGLPSPFGGPPGGPGGDDPDDGEDGDADPAQEGSGSGQAA